MKPPKPTCSQWSEADEPSQKNKSDHFWENMTVDPNVTTLAEELSRAAVTGASCVEPGSKFEQQAKKIQHLVEKMLYLALKQIPHMPPGIVLRCRFHLVLCQRLTSTLRSNILLTS
jgi:hypothetical protein